MPFGKNTSRKIIVLEFRIHHRKLVLPGNRRSFAEESDELFKDIQIFS